MASQFAVLSQEHHDTMQQADKLLESAIHEARPLTAEEQAQVDTWEARLDELDDVLSVERKRRALREREQAPREQAREARRDATPWAFELAAKLDAHADFRDWLARSAPNGVARSGVHLESPRVEFGALAPLRLNPATAGGALVIPDQYGIVPFPRRPLSIRALVTNLTTNSDAVEYVLTTSQTNNAAMTPEAADITTGGVGSKPQSDMAVARRSTTVKTVSNWMAATRQVLADAQQLLGMVETFLTYNLELALEDQMMTGDGTGENFDGIGHVAGTLSQVFSTNILNTARKARTLARLTGHVVPTAYAMNPADWETYDLSQDNQARYYYGGPDVSMTPRLWGLPVVESEAVPAGTAYLADWKYAILWDRQQGAVYMTDSHADFFVKNLIAILAEARAAFAVVMPQAFVHFPMS